jgi:hypothetical protein
MPFAIITVIVQVLLIVHVLRTGREFWWILLLLFLPGIGALIYIAVEIVPSLAGGLAARKALRRVGNVVDPGRGLRQQQLAYERSRNVDTATRLANELIRDGKHDEAIEVCEGARTGLFESDPTILLTLASAQFGTGAFDATVATLDLLRERNPSFRSPDGHLLYARALDAAGRTERAIEEYDAVAHYYPGAEARVRLAQLHDRIGNTESAAEMFERIVEDARLAPKHFQRAQREWIEIAKKHQGP